MASRKMRWAARAGVVALAVGVAAPAAWAANSWSPGPNADKATGTATNQYSWNYGSSFSKLGNGKVALTYTSDAGTANSVQSTYARIGTVDPTTKAVTWGKPKMTSQSSKIADRTSLAAGGNNVYAGFVTQTSYVIDPAQPRVAYVRSQVSGTWGSPVKLTSGTGRVDYPILSASGDNVYVVYTNSNNGAVTMRRSTNAGATFPGSIKLGTTTRDDGEGLAAWPIACATGTNSAAVWLKGDGTIKLSVSENSGTSYTTKTINSVNAGGNEQGWASCDATGTRIGITWNENDGVYYAEYDTATDTFTTPRTNIFPFSGSGYAASYSGTVALFGTGTVGIAAPLCVQDGCDYTSNTTQIDLRWLESTNNGDTFAAEEAIANSSVQGKKLNDSPSALFYDANTRFVLYNGWTAPYTNYRLYLSTGTS
jgi:hypothetical protein